MAKVFDLQEFLEKYPYAHKWMEESNIQEEDLKAIYQDYMMHMDAYQKHGDFIANILRSQESIHTVKSRIKDPEGLIEKVIRKTADRKAKYGQDFYFSVDNYKDEINDLIGIRVMHIFKEQWQEIHEYITSTWNIVEMTANVREGDNVEVFKDLNIEVRSRASGYRSVHYLVEFYPTNRKVIAEIQVRTIFEEGYGEIDHRLRYSHVEISDILKSNLLLFNRIIGCADEMASLINTLNKEWGEKQLSYNQVIDKQQREIEQLKRQLKEQTMS